MGALNVYLFSSTTSSPFVSFSSLREQSGFETDDFVVPQAGILHLRLEAIFLHDSLPLSPSAFDGPIFFVNAVVTEREIARVLIAFVM